MCTCPVTIPNVNFRDEPPKDPYLRRFTNWQTRYMQVPCGHCRECKAGKTSNYLQQFQLSTFGNYAYMVTLTYKEPEKPTFVMPDGSEVGISSYKHVTDMIKRLRKYPEIAERGLKYMIVDEYSPKKLRPHYHGILELGKLPGDTNSTPYTLEKFLFDTVLKEWRVNKAFRQYTEKNSGKRLCRVNTRKPDWHQLCDYVVSYRHGKRHTTYDLHFITPSYKKGVSDVSYYLTKYFFKENPADETHLKHCIKAMDDYEQGLELYKELFRTRVRKSLNFSGIWTAASYKEYLSTKNDLCLEYYKPVRDHLDRCEQFSFKKADGTYFLDVVTNVDMPLAPIFRKYLSFEAQLLYKEWLIKTYGSVIDRPTEDKTEKAIKDIQFMKKQILSDIFDES